MKLGKTIQQVSLNTVSFFKSLGSIFQRRVPLEVTATEHITLDFEKEPDLDEADLSIGLLETER